MFVFWGFLTVSHILHIGIPQINYHTDLEGPARVGIGSD